MKLIRSLGLPRSQDSKECFEKYRYLGRSRYMAMPEEVREGMSLACMSVLREG